MARFLLICLGGAVGTGARYLFATAMTRAFGNFPFGTLGVNVLGSFLASVVMVLARNDPKTFTPRVPNGKLPNARVIAVANR